MNKKYITQALSLIIVLIMITGCVQVDESTGIDSNYNPEERLRELNITLPTPPQPVANYVNGVRAGNLIFLAGKGPKYPDGRELTGKLGGNITIDQGYEGARQTAINQLSVLKEMLGDLNKVKRIVKVLGLVNSSPNFIDQPKVVNGFSDLMVDVFGEKGKHAELQLELIHYLEVSSEIELVVEVYD